jgi:hypothetical protein
MNKLIEAAVVEPQYSKTEREFDPRHLMSKLDAIHRRFVDERVAGFTTPEGVTHPPCSREEAEARWAKAEQAFMNALSGNVAPEHRENSKSLQHKLGLTRPKLTGAIYRDDPTVPDTEPETDWESYEKSWHKQESNVSAVVRTLVTEAIDMPTPEWEIDKHFFDQALHSIRSRFVDERVSGFMTPDGVKHPPVSREEAEARWAKAENVFKKALMNPSPKAAKSLKLGRKLSPYERGMRDEPSLRRGESKSSSIVRKMIS